MLKRPHYIALSLVLFLVLVIVNLPTQTATHLKLALGGLFLPLFGLATSAHALTEQAANALIPRPALLARLEQLQRENSQFRVREMQVAQIFRENERLRQSLNWQKQAQWKLRAARVIVRDPANWWRSIQIDAGQRDGIVLDLPVLTPDGLVGRIQQVGATRSRVALVGDPECPVSAVVAEGPVRDYGVIASGSPGVLDGSLVNLTYVSRPAAMKPGQRVLTSGIGGIFPPDILIGHIVDTNNVGFGLYTEARIKLGANLDSLEEVWVVLP
ncbi:MAG: rod shape-determining protein MreC [Verrucomicrobiota bacterium]